MINKIILALFFTLFTFSCCYSQSVSKQKFDTSQQSNKSVAQPNFNYTIEIPDGWTVRDTTMLDGLRIRFLLPPQHLLADYPIVNVLIASMQGSNIDDHTTRNIEYLKSNMPGITILERGKIDSTTYDGRWFTYTKEINGTNRDMINYIIPLNGFSYMITCGCNKGTIDKYRATFDKIARSFKG